jgi:hypothetical protein
VLFIYFFFVTNTILFIASSLNNPGYLEKDPNIKLIDLLKITQDVNEICPSCEVNINIITYN